MSVIVRNMEMPISCAECPIGGSMRCALIPGVPAWWAEYDQCVEEKKLHSQCPLIPVPPHGRLGDLDALAQLFKEKATEHGGIGGIMVAMAAGCIDAAPTIIPAE